LRGFPLARGEPWRHRLASSPRSSLVSPGGAAPLGSLMLLSVAVRRMFCVRTQRGGIRPMAGGPSTHSVPGREHGQGPLPPGRGRTHSARAVVRYPQQQQHVHAARTPGSPSLVREACVWPRWPSSSQRRSRRSSRSRGISGRSDADRRFRPVSRLLGGAGVASAVSPGPRVENREGWDARARLRDAGGASLGAPGRAASTRLADDGGSGPRRPSSTRLSPWPCEVLMAGGSRDLGAPFGRCVPCGAHRGRSHPPATPRLCSRSWDPAAGHRPGPSRGADEPAVPRKRPAWSPNGSGPAAPIARDVPPAGARANLPGKGVWGGGWGADSEVVRAETSRTGVNTVTGFRAGTHGGVGWERLHQNG